MTTLDPNNDIKIDKFALDEESANIAFLIYEYDKLWHNANDKLLKYTAQLENYLDDLKSLKGSLAFKAKARWKDYKEFDKAPTDKVAENWVFTQPEYKDLINKISEKRKQVAENQSLDNKYKNFHFVLMEKAKKIEKLINLYLNEYYSKPENIEPDKVRELEEKESIETANDMNGQLKDKLKRRKLKKG